MSDKIQKIAEEDAKRIQTLTRDAARSGAYLYPIKGILYFLRHRSLWSPLLSNLTPTLSLGLGVTAFMFLVTYVPQMAVMALFEGPLAAISAAGLVLSESSTLTNIGARAWWVESALVDTFDGTLVSRSETALVTRGREVKPGHDPMQRLGKMLTRPFAKFTPKALVRYFMYLPLNFIPVVGTVLFVMLQGKRTGPFLHSRYFELKGMSRRQQEQFVEERRGAYTGFGVVATLLEMVPVVGIFFAFTNTVGAALWASDMEGRSTTAPGLRERAKMAEE
ncbi:hypothetical protein EV356DRAFT_455668 [Viridothelium virens]|uniref:Outer spore wall protein RRT8 n=1 Tax=Viridothelium virens TaxID=1048519 RepID=A0A6A6GUQ2_VIRVR|nr:hypothetical protein EV356DRAFT_455668 [Viridothelium virens]